jgi:Flp pilus assembly protein TadB
MGRRRGQGPQRQVKGFRPGKEPPRLRKQRAKQQFGEMNAAQERLVEFFAERSPDEARALMGRWRLALLLGAVLLGVVGAALYSWSTVAGIIVHVLAVIVLVLWWQIRRQREALETMADQVGGRPGKRRRTK